MAQDVGRNDPCPCGSGVKYKYCCINKPSDASSTSSSAAPTTETESSTLSLAEQAYEEFESADYEGKRVLLEDLIGDAERLDSENAFHMINALAPLAIEQGDADWVADLITRLEEEQPETYAAERPYLFHRHLEAAAATGGVKAVVAERPEVLEQLAVQDLDQFYPTIELIAYHTSLAPIAEAMHYALPDVRGDSNILPHGKSEFGDVAVQYILLAHYERHGELDVEHPDLRARIDPIDDPAWGEVDVHALEQFAARLSAPDDQSWEVEANPVDNVERLATAFMVSLYENKDIPLGRAHLAETSLVECYERRYDQHPSLDADRLLQLNQGTVRAQLEKMRTFGSSHAHKGAAFFSLLPDWLAFLEDRSLLNAAAVDTTYNTLRPLRSEVAQYLQSFSADPSVGRDVEAAWA